MTTGTEPAPSERPPLRQRGIRTLAVIIGALGVLFLVFALFNVLVTCACVAPSQRPMPESPVVGVVVRVDQESLGVIRDFDVLTVDGKTVTLAMGDLDNAQQFSPSHLASHMATGVPVRAFYRLENGQPTVYHLEDAVPASPAPSAT